jgi:hypothetical protein
MAKSRRRKPCPKPISQEEVVRRVVMTMVTALLPGVGPDIIMDKIRDAGAHHHLMEIALPETDDQEGMDYGGSLDEFEGSLSTWVEEAAEGHAEHMRRIAKRDK